MTTDEVELQDWTVIWEDDERSKDSTQNLTSNEHTMYHVDVDEDIAGDSDWNVAIEKPAIVDTTVYADGRIAYARAEDTTHEDLLVHGGVLHVGEEVTSQLISYMESNADTLEEHGELFGRLSKPPRHNAFSDTRRGSIPVEDTVAAGVQTEETDVVERYRSPVPEPLKNVRSFNGSVYIDTIKSAGPAEYFMEDEGVQGSYDVELPEIPD